MVIAIHEQFIVTMKNKTTPQIKIKIIFFCVSSVAEVLEKHGLKKPISFVRNSQNSKEEAHQLMVRLTRHTGRKYDTHTRA